MQKGNGCVRKVYKAQIFKWPMAPRILKSFLLAKILF